MLWCGWCVACSKTVQENQEHEALNACLAVVSFGRSSRNVKLFFPLSLLCFCLKWFSKKQKYYLFKALQIFLPGSWHCYIIFFINRLERISFSWGCELHNSKSGTNQIGPHDVFPRRYLLQSPMQPSRIVVLIPKPTIEGIVDLFAWLQLS